MSTGLAILTFVHVLISLVGIGTGLIVMFGLLNGKALDRWTALFLATTVATSVTGFFFPVHKFMPSHAVGILSLVVLGLAIYARYSRRLAGGWRKTYVIGAMISLYLNVFVLVAQAFSKVPALKELAPTRSEPPFKLAQPVVLLLFIALTVIATVRFRDNAVLTSQPDLHPQPQRS
jgi:hypothetical protein